MTPAASTIDSNSEVPASEAPRPRVLMLIDYYLPAYKAGGPIRTAAGIVHHLGDRFEFRILTRDHDLGDPAPWPDVRPGQWVRLGGAECRYLTAHERTLRAMRRVIRETEHDVLYVNSLFSVPMSIKPLLLRRLRLVPQVRLTLAPRGELSAGAISLKQLKKRAFLAVAKAIGLHRDVLWQASSVYEQRDVRKVFGEHAQVVVAPDLRVGVQGLQTEVLPSVARTQGSLRIAFVSRISPMKNLEGALEMLSGVRASVEFDIYGPKEDQRCWARCEALMRQLPANVTARYVRVLPHHEVDEVLRRYQLFLLPSLGENFGHVIIEALAAGCPVLISDRTPWRELESHGVGWDLPLEDVERFRAVIEACAGEGPLERQERAKRAVAFAARQQPGAEDLRSNASLFEDLGQVL